MTQLQIASMLLCILLAASGLSYLSIFCADFPLHFFSFQFFLSVDEQNPSEALRWGWGPDNLRDSSKLAKAPCR